MKKAEYIKLKFTFKLDGLSSTFFVIQRGTTMYITFNSIDQFAPCLPETFEKCFFYIYNIFILEDTK